MTEENKTTTTEVKKTVETKSQTPKTEVKSEKVEEVKTEKKEVKTVAKKGEAIAKSNNLHVSMKQSMHICKFIKNKSIDDAISDLEKVIKFKLAVPFTGEIPHRKGKMMSGRYPITAAKLFIPLLKSLKGNVLVNQIDLDKARIYFASASFAARPSKKGGGTFKRANIILKAKEMEAKIKQGDKK